MATCTSLRKEPLMTTAARPRPLPGHPTERPQVVTSAGRRFFLAENLLEARRGSWLPTNGAGYDEDVNIYLIMLLDGLATGSADARVVPGLATLADGPDPRLPRAARAAWYRANGDSRLLGLGLFAQGDLLRRRTTPWGWSPDGARKRDLAVAAACYEAAARLLDRGPTRGDALVAVLGKLAERCEDYAQVLGVLAVRRLGLGARLSAADLTGLVGTRAEADAQQVSALLASAPCDANDVVLDLVLEYKRRPEPGLRRRIEQLARMAGMDSSRLLPTAN
jgi:hypothetical protein